MFPRLYMEYKGFYRVVQSVPNQDYYLLFTVWLLIITFHERDKLIFTKVNRSLRHIMGKMYKNNLTVVRSYRLVSENWIVYNITLM